MQKARFHAGFLFFSTLFTLLCKLFYKRRKMPCPSFADIHKRDSYATPPSQYRYVPHDAELQLIRDEINFYVRAPLQVEQRRLDVATREAKVQNLPAKQKPPVGQKHLGMPFARIARISPLLTALGLRHLRSREIRHIARHIARYIGWIAHEISPSPAPGRRTLLLSIGERRGGV
jgi:hypothetical protein